MKVNDLLSQIQHVNEQYNRSEMRKSVAKITKIDEVIYPISVDNKITDWWHDNRRHIFNEVDHIIAVTY